MNDFFKSGLYTLTIGFIILFWGFVEPTACGSGNCQTSLGFYLIFGSIAIIGSLIMLIGVLKEDE